MISKRKTVRMKDPDDIRYQLIQSLVRSMPVVALYIIISGLAQVRSNEIFDANEIQNLAEGAPAMAVAYALLKLRKII